MLFYYVLCGLQFPKQLERLKQMSVYCHDKSDEANNKVEAASAHLDNSI